MKDPLAAKLNEAKQLQSEYPISFHGRHIHYANTYISDSFLQELETIGLEIVDIYPLIENHCVEVK